MAGSNGNKGVWFSIISAFHRQALIKCVRNFTLRDATGGEVPWRDEFQQAASPDQPRPDVPSRSGLHPSVKPSVRSSKKDGTGMLCSPPSGGHIDQWHIRSRQRWRGPPKDSCLPQWQFSAEPSRKGT